MTDSLLMHVVDTGADLHEESESFRFGMGVPRHVASVGVDDCLLLFLIVEFAVVEVCFGVFTDGAEVGCEISFITVLRNNVKRVTIIKVINHLQQILMIKLHKRLQVLLHHLHNFLFYILQKDLLDHVLLFLKNAQMNRRET